MFAFILACTVLTTILIGLVPAFGATSLNLVDSLKAGGQKSGTASHHPRLRNGLVVFQIAMALVLVVASGLLIRSFYLLLNVDGGFRTQHVLTFELSLPAGQYPERAQIVAFYREALPRLRAVPGVRSLALTEAVPMGSAPESTAIRIVGRPPVRPGEAPIVNYTIVSPAFFATLETLLEQGRDFLDSDDPAGTRPSSLSIAQWPENLAG